MREGAGAWVDTDNIPGVFDWVVAFLGLLGLAVALWQILRSNSALRAAHRSYHDTRAALASTQVISALPRLSAELEGVTVTLHQSTRSIVEPHLFNFARESKELAVLLEIVSEEEYGDTITQLRSVAGAVLIARAALYSANPLDTNAFVLGEAPAEMSTLVTDLAAVATRLRNTPAITATRRS